jgi:penicillin-insensitive murein DD-endopeptidase
MRLSRNRNWGNPQLVRFIERLAENAKKIGWNGLLVGEMSQPRGGPMLSDHKSQIGLDVDIWLTPMPDHVQSRQEREFGSATDTWSRPICSTSIRKCGPIGIPNSSAPLRRIRGSRAS